MASLIDLRRRVRSVKNMRQIFRAMKMISASRLRRSQERILQTRPYAFELRKVTQNLAAQAPGEAAHPLLEQRPAQRVLFLVVSGDKGLCGAFNSTVLRTAERRIAGFDQGEILELLCLGKRASDYFSRRRTKIRKAYRSLFTKIRYEQAQEIADDLSRAFTDGEYDAVYVVYNQFVSVMTQKISIEKLLPIDATSVNDGVASSSASSAAEAPSDYLYEPSSEALLEVLLPRFLTFQVYRILLESQAAEHAARMTAMEAATKNASDLIDRLTLKLNRARQAAITTELIEVVSGANAMEG